MKSAVIGALGARAHKPAHNHRLRLVEWFICQVMGRSAKGDAGLPAEEGVPVRIPIDRRLRDGLNDLGPGLEAMPGERERAQRLPPRLDEVEVGGLFVRPLI